MKDAAHEYSTRVDFRSGRQPKPGDFRDVGPGGLSVPATKSASEKKVNALFPEMTASQTTRT